MTTKHHLQNTKSDNSERQSIESKIPQIKVINETAITATKITVKLSFLFTDRFPYDQFKIIFVRARTFAYLFFIAL